MPETHLNRLLGIDSPADLRQLPEGELPELAQELRGFLLHSVARTGGHLAANLGVIELTLALHYVFDTPEDRLVWDVGHQSYAHKVLTGRRDAFPSLRQLDGLSGFTKRSESPYDPFGAGHSSTSISAALGMALASREQGLQRDHIAVIGDGALTAGMAFEAMNHAGDTRADLLVVLNDNEMSISRNVGAMSRYLSRLLSGRMYASLREGSKKMLGGLPPVFEFARRTEEHIKGMLTPGTLFEELGFTYFGPVDGHNLPELVAILRNLRQIRGPRLLHVVTRKGMGYAPAEEDPCAYHGVSRFDPRRGPEKTEPAPAPVRQSFTDVFGRWLCDMAQADPRLVAITPAMREGSGMVEFAERFPERFHDVGIAEQHAVTFAAGLACEGLKPVVAIYSTFLQRAYDQLIHDVALQNLPVLFAIDRAGLVGADGATHAGAFDLSFLACVPNLLLMTPSDEEECRRMLSTGFLHDGPAAVRYPRGGGPGTAPGEDLLPLPIGRAERRRQGRGIALLVFGSLLTEALAVAETLDATVLNMRFVKPLDEACVLEVAQDHDHIVTLEENARIGGAGSLVNQLLAQQPRPPRLLNLGLDDAFGGQGTREQVLAIQGIDRAGILATIRRFLESGAPTP
ncbi:MAG: 1-deoxy-D-xylulose-5-phosphate synthase [Halothiobacillaceae bacterium]|nr:1-deoxy-D-xylulose-5-phosphate synthase [Halothiobacillaceae bacterium]